MYELFALVMIGLFALIGIGGLEHTLATQKANVSRLASKAAADYLTQGELDYLAQVATYASNPSNTTSFNPGNIISVEKQMCPTVGTAPTGQTNVKTSISGANGSSCNYYVTYQTVTAGGSGLGGSGQTSYGINDNAQEQRLSAIITVTVRNAPQAQAGSIVLATKNRTITVRSYASPPYASIVNSSDTQDPFIAAETGKIGGTSTQDTAEGDIAGAINTPTKDNNTISSYSACTYGNSNAQTSGMMNSWCTGQNASTIATQNANGNYSNTAQVSGTWQPVNTTPTTLSTKTWGSTTSSVNAGN